MEKINIKDHISINKLYNDIAQDMGHDQESAINDLIDNSIDAQAKNILIHVTNSSGFINSISIIDDGNGMDKERFIKSFAMANDCPHEDGSAGKYGVGGNTAAFFLASKKQIFSTECKLSKPLFYGEMSLSQIENVSWGSPTINSRIGSTYLEIISELNSNATSGTVVVLTDLKTNNISSRAKTFLEKIAQNISITFRYKIKSGINIYTQLNDEDPTLIKMSDPFFKDNTELLSIAEHSIPLIIQNNENEYMIEISISGLNKNKFEEEISFNTSGVYFVRNGREIVTAAQNKQSHMLYRFHPTTNGLRIEIKYSSEIDFLIKTNAIKNKISSIEENLKEQIKQIISPIQARYINLTKKTITRKSEKAFEDLIDSLNTKALQNNGSLEIPLKITKTQRSGVKNPGSGSVTPKGTDIKKNKQELSYKYKLVNDSRSSWSYNIDFEDGIVIEINEASHFYKNYFFNASEDAKRAMYIIITNQGLALQDYVNDSSFEKFTSFTQKMSRRINDWSQII